MLRALASQLQPSATSVEVAGAPAGAAAAAARRLLPPPRKIVIAEMSHETNTFSPVITDLARFGGGLPGSGAIPPSGLAVVESHRGSKHSGLGGFIELADEISAEIVASVAASAPPSGVVQDDAFDYICAAICDTVAAEQPDAIMLCLHGAMVVESHEDGEGELLRRIRELVITQHTAVVLPLISH